LSLTHVKILVSELVGNVPADRTEFTTVLDDSVEKAKTEEEFLELEGFAALAELLLGD
jgi:hypothetical protein